MRQGGNRVAAASVSVVAGDSSASNGKGGVLSRASGAGVTGGDVRLAGGATLPLPSMATSLTLSAVRPAALAVVAPCM
jgi:hypothetical protein